jgi:hypothetical protein
MSFDTSEARRALSHQGSFVSDPSHRDVNLEFLLPSIVKALTQAERCPPLEGGLRTMGALFPLEIYPTFPTFQEIGRSCS